MAFSTNTAFLGCGSLKLKLREVADQLPVVRETACKTILNRSSLGGYSLNCYTGCAHACVYCYARFMQRFHPHDEPWGAFVNVKLNAVEVLKRQLRRATPGEVFMSSACDGWQPIEAKYRLTRRCCELLLERGFSLHVLTKSPLILRDLDLFAGREAVEEGGQAPRGTPVLPGFPGPARSQSPFLHGHDVSVGVTITTPDDRLARLWEPGCTGGLSQFSSDERGLSQLSSDENGTVPFSPTTPTAIRWYVIDEARRRGLATSVMFGPLLPLLSDGPAEIESLLVAAAAHGVDTIWVDAMNARPASGRPSRNYCGDTFPSCESDTKRFSSTARCGRPT